MWHTLHYGSTRHAQRLFVSQQGVSVQGLEGYIPRLQPVVWDHGFCIEGRNDEELPEVRTRPLPCPIRPCLRATTAPYSPTSIAIVGAIICDLLVSIPKVVGTVH